MSTIEMSFRPDTYWPESLTPEQRLSRIRGKKRQEIARDLYAKHGFTALNEFLVKEGLAEEERTAWGAVGPWCLGGEYLPSLEQGEVEIARISLESTTADQISVRAQPGGDSIHYRIVGEYEEDEGMRYQLPFETSAQPLSLAELMKLIDGAQQDDCAYPGGILTSMWAMMSDYYHDTQEIISFLSLDSAFYPQIGQAYQDLAWRWIEEHVEVEDEA
jgi:hypothetical protein